ncbi:unnamed protein product [Withania somnifera]
MLAISSPVFSTSNNFGWLLEDLVSHELSSNGETSNSDIAIRSSTQKSLQHCDSNKFDHQTINGGDHNQPDPTVKKLNHNASERDRRKKINGLYSTLRSLLPASEHTKKLSIPSTVSRILKYIPELQSEVERLTQKKDEFTLRTISNKGNSTDFNKQKEKEKELRALQIIFQISTLKNNKGSISEAISVLEDEGLVLLNATSFETFEDRVFYTLHFQVEGTMVVEVDMLRDKLLSYFENEENVL